MPLPRRQHHDPPHPHRLRRVALGLVLAGGLLAGCAGDLPDVGREPATSGPSPTTNPPTSTAASTPVPSTTVAPMTIAPTTIAPTTIAPTTAAPASSTTIPVPATSVRWPSHPLSAADPLRVLTVGDGVMFDAEPAISAALTSGGAARVTPGAYFGSGLTRPEQLDWRKVWADQVASSGADLVVVMTGAWDARPVTVDGAGGRTVLEPGQPAWAEWYAGVVGEALQVLQVGGASVVWVGPLAEADPAKSARLAAVADVLQDVVGRTPGARYVDANQAIGGTDAYVASLPALDGSTVTLRAADGEHLCPAGAERVASAVVAALPAGVPPVDPGWTTGPWRADGRYRQPEDRCGP